MLTPLLLALAQSPAEPAHFSCGPFLLQPSPRGITIVVDHETPVPASVRYWTSERNDERTIDHDDAARHHVFALDGLVPGTVYSYEITSDALSTGTHEFRTLPERPERYRFLAVGDVRTHPESWAQVSGRMFEHEPDALFVVGTGDYPTDGRKYDQWINEFFAPARPLLGRMPFWPAIGNHEATRRHDDVTNIEHSHYLSLFELPGNERWYRVDYDLVTLLIVDSNSYMSPGEPQYDWLRTELRSPRNRFTLVALHHAPLTSGPHGRLHPDGTPVEWPLDQGRRFLVPLFEMYGVDLVLTGHDHLYERSEKDGVVYVVTGGGGAPLYAVDSVENPYQQVAVSTHHYVALDVDADGIELTAIDEDGATIDTAVIPVTEKHVARRTVALTRLLEWAVEVGPLDTSTHVAEVVVSNPFDQPLFVTIEAGRSGNRAEPLEALLEAGDRLELPWLVEDVGDTLASEPWRRAVVLDQRIRFAGRDQALDLEVDHRQETTVYHPIYDVPRLDAVALDGALSEWERVPPMLVDGETPIVKYPRSYDGPEDFGARIRSAWSDGWLHLSFDVDDEAVVDDATTNIDLNDCVRVLFDVREGPSKGVVEYTFGASGRTDTEDTRIQHVTRQRDGGWVLEASFPLELLGLGPEVDAARISADFLLVDRDVEGEEAKPSYHRLWTESRSRSDTSTFGVLVLEQP